MPLAGRGADLWGARRLYVVALLLFVIGSAGAGLARMAGPENGLDLADRRAASCRASAAGPSSRCRWHWPATSSRGRARAFALGVEGAAIYIGMAIGPAYGAWVLLNFSLPIPGLDIARWQWIFLLNVPIAIVTLLLIYVVAGGIETPRVPGRLDLRRGAAAERRAGRRHRRDHRSRASAAGPTRSSSAACALGRRWRSPPSSGSSSDASLAARRPPAVRRPGVLRREPRQPADRLHAGDGGHRRAGLRQPRPVRHRCRVGDGADRADPGDRRSARWSAAWPSGFIGERLVRLSGSR